MPTKTRQYRGEEIRWRTLSQDDRAWIDDNPRWKKWLAVPEFAGLVGLLLGIGGETVVPPMQLPPSRFWVNDFKQVVREGRFFPGKPVCMIEMAGCQCHRNVSALWEQNEGDMSIATGYALSKDGRWRSHTWGVALEVLPCGDFDVVNPGGVVETTESRVCYFGYPLNDDQAKRFWRANA